MTERVKTAYVCSECGNTQAKWSGKCSSCGNWNTLTETIVSTAKNNKAPTFINNDFSALNLNEISLDAKQRFKTGISELDNVLGGGIVKGSAVFLSGDPGIGKSTILLQIANKLPNLKEILYVSGEESASQIKIRAERLGVSGKNLVVVCEDDVLKICDYISAKKPDMVMIDSIQTMRIDELSSSAGSVVQVRESTNLLLRTCKVNEIPLFVVGHVNKGGEIAGPKVLEHIVDTVLYFEGERNQSYRILRAVKNRFGSTNEIGVFEMSENGLEQVANPSAMLLSGRAKNASGSFITCVVEGTRPILAEVQGLVTTTGFGNPRRVSTGFDFNRLNLILAILEKRLGIHFSTLDTYLNVTGGIKLDEPAADLAVALSLISALRDVPVSMDTIAFGEMGLSGEIRSVARVQERVKEAARLGFKTCILPKACLSSLKELDTNMEILGVSTIHEAAALIR